MADVWHYVCDSLPGDCCGSCHEDENEFNIGMMESYLDEGDTCHVFSYCCGKVDDGIDEALMKHIIAEEKKEL